MSQIKLKPSSILSVQIQNYGDNFSFLVNDEEFKTSLLAADLLSSNISRIHQVDPTFDTIKINTQHKGHFSNILSLINFEPTNIPDNELPFIYEVLDQIGTESFEIPQSKESLKITLDNAFELIQNHEKFPNLFSKQLESEIQFVSSHFFEVSENRKEEFLNLKLTTIQKILSNDKLLLKDEDELIEFINYLNTKDSNKFLFLYETVLFSNVSSAKMKDFVSIFDFNNMTYEIWNNLAGRLTNEIQLKSQFEPSKRYKKINKKPKGIKFEYKSDKEFSGIVKYLKDKTSNQIENEIKVTFSSNCESYGSPIDIFNYENKSKGFCSQNNPNSWICFDFIKQKIVLTDCQIKSWDWTENWNPKSFTIEGSLDNNSWDVLDEQKNCPYLKDNLVVHRFTVSNQTSKEYRYIRFRQTDKNWVNNDYFSFKRIEFYGELI